MGFNVLVVVLVFSLLNICTGRIESPLLQLIRLLELFAGNGYHLDFGWFYNCYYTYWLYFTSLFALCSIRYASNVCWLMTRESRSPRIKQIGEWTYIRIELSPPTSSNWGMGFNCWRILQSNPLNWYRPSSACCTRSFTSPRDGIKPAKTSIQ